MTVKKTGRKIAKQAGKLPAQSSGKNILQVGKRMFPFGSTGWGWDPILCLESIRLTMNSLYVELFKKSESFLEEIPWEPPLDMFTHKGRLFIEIELPGVKKEDISLHATTTLLIIAGRNRREIDVEDKNFIVSERKSGRFYRSIPLPLSIIPEEIRTEFKEGILRVMFLINE